MNWSLTIADQAIGRFSMTLSRKHQGTHRIPFSINAPTLTPFAYPAYAAIRPHFPRFLTETSISLRVSGESVSSIITFCTLCITVFGSWNVPLGNKLGRLSEMSKKNKSDQTHHNRGPCPVHEERARISSLEHPKPSKSQSSVCPTVLVQVPVFQVLCRFQ